MDRTHGRLRVPLAAVADEVDRPSHPERHRVAKLLQRFGGAQGEDDRLAAVLLDKAHGLLDGAFLVGADGGAQVFRIDGPGIPRQGDPAGHRRDALDADEDLHRQARIRSLSGSNNGLEPTTATVTG